MRPGTSIRSSRARKQAATGVTAYTRTWNVPKPDILALGSAIGPDMVLEAKFNGEQLGPPYAIAGGAMSDAGNRTRTRAS